MGRPPSNGAPSFRFYPAEVAQMDAILQKHEGHVPPRDFLVALAHRFSQSPERAGKIDVQMKQVWNWFQNRRYALRAKLVKSPVKHSASFVTRNEVTPLRNLNLGPQQMSTSSGPHSLRNASALPSMEFEAKSARDGAWYDVHEFLSHRYIDTGNPEVLVCFAGFSPGEDEWVNIRKHVRQRSLPCETSECIVVLPGDLILCFQEGKEQALYFDAHVLDAQRRTHDIRGCRCRFLVRFDHDQSEEIVPLRKICRRPETDYRLQQLHATNEASTSVTVQRPIPVVDLTDGSPVELTTSDPCTAATTTTTVSPPPVVIAGPQAPIPPPPGYSTPSPIGFPDPKSTPIPPPPGYSTPSPIGVPGPPIPPPPGFSTPSPIGFPGSKSTSIPPPPGFSTPSPIGFPGPPIPPPPGFSTTSPIGFPGPKSTPVPEQQNLVSPLKVENDNPAKIPDPVTDSNKNETDNSHLVPGLDKVASNSPDPVSVPIKVENENSDPVPKPNNVESINSGISDGFAGAQANFTVPVEAIKVKAERMESSVAETVALTGSSASHVDSAKTQPR
ncbi:protein SAWADEE HOMEODOMAIN HOMOLOG 2-like [Silene latifolia]|uniref:protein SAWADEE HOMEODOMAIN HOMOLOG 2-like n=1 Tax=Silene latifolia TaxID=37657 RepID=UPI003D77EE1B